MRLYILIMLMFMTFIASAATFQQGTDIILTESCKNINCSDGEINISVMDSSGNTIIDNSATTIYNGYISFPLNSTQTANAGEYTYYLASDGDSFSNNFFISSTGETPTTAGGLAYLIVIFVSLALFLFSVLWFNSLQWSHYTGSEGNIVQVSTDRRNKIVAFFLGYSSLLFLVFSLYVMSSSMILSNNISNVLYPVFIILLTGYAPIILAIIVIAVITTIADAKLQKALLRGF